MELAIKPNNIPHREPCAICGKSIDVRMPYDIFPAYSARPLCNQCAEKHAPDLKHMLDNWFSEAKDFTQSDMQVMRKKIQEHLDSKAAHH